MASRLPSLEGRTLYDTASDGGVRQDHIIHVPLMGLMEGIDPATINYPPDAAPVLQNIRISKETWLTRLGQTLQYSSPDTTKAPRFLDFLYQSSGAFTWLMAQGSGATAQLYEIKLGTDTGFVTASGGGSLGGSTEPYFQGTTLADRFYLTDRQNVLFKYSPTGSPNHLSSLTLPTAPATSPTCVPRPFGVLENYNTAWTASNAGNFSQATDSTSNPPPDGSVSSHLNCINSGALNNNVKSTDFIFPAQYGTYVGGISHSLAFWVKQDQNAVTQSIRMQLQFGSNTATDYTVSMYSDKENVDTWYPFFVPIGDINSMNFFRVFVQSCKGGGSNWMSSVYLPGTLEGPYRWVYTYYDSTGDRESAPSPISNNGQPLDFSVEGVSFDQNTAGAFQKSCMIIPTLSGDSSVSTIRLYRNGGVPSLTLDENGLPLWLLVDTIPNFSTTVNQVGQAVGDVQITLSSVTGLSVGNWLVFEPGTTGKQEALQITLINAGTKTVTLTAGLNYATSTGRPDGFQFTHANGSTVRACYVDNTPNEAIQTLNTLDVPIITAETTRGAAPAAIKFIQRSPEGRLWAFGYSGHKNGIAVSNLATPFRPNDFETFTVGVDPLTRQSETMGWNFDIFKNLAQDEAIEWGGFFQGWATVLTRGNLYRVNAHSQREWGPTSVQRIHQTGCLPGAGDTVREVDGVLYWVAPGPRVMAWDGRGEPEDIGYRRINVRLKAASPPKWKNWFATTHRRQEGSYYCLYFASSTSGANGCDQRLDYNTNMEAWEPCLYFNSDGSAQHFSGAFSTDVPAQTVDGLFQIDSKGNVFQAENGLTDGGNPIQIQFSTPKIPLYVLHQVWFRFIDESMMQSFKMRMPAVNDTVTMTVATERSEYTPVSHSYTIPLLGNLAGIQNPAAAATPGTIIEIFKRVDRDLLGRACQLTVSGSVSNQPEFQTIIMSYVPLHHGQIAR